MGRLRAHDLFERRLGHALLPSGIAQLETVSARIKEIELPAREIAFGAVGKLNDGNLFFVKNFAVLHKRFRTHGERMVNSMLCRNRFIDALLALAEEDVVVSHIEAGHDSIPKPP